ncbi:hypothetical protein [Dyadobacter beijingensis]|nr:hypothetical protein [Dyadobacter beijingensis]
MPTGESTFLRRDGYLSVLVNKSISLSIQDLSVLNDRQRQAGDAPLV